MGGVADVDQWDWERGGMKENLRSDRNGSQAEGIKLEGKYQKKQRRDRYRRSTGHL